MQGVTIIPYASLASFDPLDHIQANMTYEELLVKGTTLIENEDHSTKIKKPLRLFRVRLVPEADRSLNLL